MQASKLKRTIPETIKFNNKKYLQRCCCNWIYELIKLAEWKDLNIIIDYHHQYTLWFWLSPLSSLCNTFSTLIEHSQPPEIFSGEIDSSTNFITKEATTYCYSILWSPPFHSIRSNQTSPFHQLSSLPVISLKLKHIEDMILNSTAKLNQQVGGRALVQARWKQQKSPENWVSHSFSLTISFYHHFHFPLPITSLLLASISSDSLPQHFLYMWSRVWADGGSTALAGGGSSPVSDHNLILLPSFPSMKGLPLLPFASNK